MKTNAKKVMVNQSLGVRGIVLVLIGISLSLLTGCNREGGGMSAAYVRPAPDFSIRDMNNKLVRLEDLRGQVIFLHFWASWCPPCLEEIPRWIAAAPRFKGQPVKLVAITVDEKLDNALKIFPQSKIPDNMLLLWDPDSRVAQSYGTSKFPETYLLNASLEIVDKWIGSQDWESSRVRFMLTKALMTTKQGK